MLAKSLLYVTRSIARRYYTLIRATELIREAGPSNAFANSPHYDDVFGCCRLASFAKKDFPWAKGVRQEMQGPRQSLCGIGRSLHKATQNVLRRYFPKLSTRRYCQSILELLLGTLVQLRHLMQQ